MSVLKALAMLEGCPQGSSLPMLRQHGFDGQTLVELAEQGLVRLRLHSFAEPAGLEVVWFYINEAGRKRLKGA